MKDLLSDDAAPTDSNAKQLLEMNQELRGVIKQMELEKAGDTTKIAHLEGRVVSLTEERDSVAADNEKLLNRMK